MFKESNILTKWAKAIEPIDPYGYVYVYEKETLEGYECNIIILYFLDVGSSPIPFFIFLSPFFLIYWVQRSQHEVILIFSYSIRFV